MGADSATTRRTIPSSLGTSVPTTIAPSPWVELLSSADSLSCSSGNGSVGVSRSDGRTVDQAPPLERPPNPLNGRRATSAAIPNCSRHSASSRCQPSSQRWVSRSAPSSMALPGQRSCITLMALRAASPAGLGGQPGWWSCG